MAGALTQQEFDRRVWRGARGWVMFGMISFLGMCFIWHNWIVRFLQPSQIKIDSGFVNRSSGIVILDVRSWGWEDVVVAVRDVENSEGGVSFNAKEVIELGGGGSKQGTVNS